MTLLEAASIACSSERLLAVMSIQDVRKMHAFLNAILSDVICKQVLPNAVKPFHDAFGLDFSFQPEIQLYANSNDNLASCDIEVTVTAPQLSGWKHRTGLFYDSFARDSLTYLLGNVRKTTFLQLALLNNMFGRWEDVMRNSSVLRVTFGNILKPPTSLATFKCPPDLCISFEFQKHKSFEDILAAFIMDGCDLTAVQPLMDTEVLG